MAKDLQIREAVIPDDYKLILESTTIQCDPATLPVLPTFNDSLADMLMIDVSPTKPGTTYVCDKYITYNYSPTTTISVNTSTYEIDIPIHILLNIASWYNNFRFIRFGICINGLNIKNEFEDIANIYFNISLTFGYHVGDNTSNTTLVETIKQGSTFKFAAYYYDFIYDTRANTLMFDKKTF